MSKPKAGDNVTITDRLWAVVDEKGMVVLLSQDHLAIFSTRDVAKFYCDDSNGERVLRLSDLSGIVQ